MTGRRAERSGARALLARLGTGLVTGAADDDPGGIGTHSQVGARFGYGLAWTFVFSFPLLFVIDSVRALFRVAVVNGVLAAPLMAVVKLIAGNPCAMVIAVLSGRDDRTGLFEQFEGFHDLEAIDLASYAGRSVPMDVVLGRERTRRSQVIKQADVVALLALLPEVFPAGTDGRNFDHYAPRCSHGSSLSTAMHGLAAARLGRTEAALDYFRRTAAIDLGDTTAALAGGVHMAALGGLWMMAILGFVGVSFREDGIDLKPQLPDDWTRLRVPLEWRGRRLAIDIDTVRRILSISMDTGEAMAVYACNARHRLEPGKPLVIRMPIRAPASGGSGHAAL